MANLITFIASIFIIFIVIIQIGVVSIISSTSSCTTIVTFALLIIAMAFTTSTTLKLALKISANILALRVIIVAGIVTYFYRLVNIFSLFIY